MLALNQLLNFRQEICGRKLQFKLPHPIVQPQTKHQQKSNRYSYLFVCLSMVPFVCPDIASPPHSPTKFIKVEHCLSICLSICLFVCPDPHPKSNCRQDTSKKTTGIVSTNNQIRTLFVICLSICLSVL